MKIIICGCLIAQIKCLDALVTTQKNPLGRFGENQEGDKNQEGQEGPKSRMR